MICQIRKWKKNVGGMLVGGLITLGIGVIFLMVNLGILPDFGEMWPLIPIIVGVALIVGAFHKGKKSDESGQLPG